MKVLNFRDFLKKYILKNDTMNEFQLPRVYKYSVYPRFSKIYSDKVLLILITDLKVALIGLVL